MNMSMSLNKSMSMSTALLSGRDWARRTTRTWSWPWTRTGLDGVVPAVAQRLPLPVLRQQRRKIFTLAVRHNRHLGRLIDHQDTACRDVTRGPANIQKLHPACPPSQPPSPSTSPTHACCCCCCPTSTRRFQHRLHSTMSEIVHPTIKGKLYFPFGSALRMQLRAPLS